MRMMIAEVTVGQRIVALRAAAWMRYTQTTLDFPSMAPRGDGKGCFPMIPVTWPPIPTLAQVSPGESPLLSLLLIIGVLLIIISLVMMMRKRRRRIATEPTAREQLEHTRQKQRMRGDLEQLMVELEQLTKRFSAQLDAKTLQLEKLVNQADRRIDELKRLQDGPVDAPDVSPPPHAPEDAETALQVGSTGSSAAHTTTPRGATVAAANGSTPAPPSDRTASREEDDLTRAVHALADQGLDAADIARQLDEHIGKVELMLALRKV